MSSLNVLLSAKPRVRVSPKYPTSDGPDAIFLSTAYGLTPDPWQGDAVTDWLGRRRDGQWSASMCALAVARQNGKNGVIEIRELYGMIALGEKFLHTAHEVKTARKAFKRLKYFFGDKANDPGARFPELNALVVEVRNTNGQEAIVLRNGGSVEFVARSKGSGRGFTVDVLVLDEAQDLSNEELEALLPTISAAPLGNPQVILTGTPPNPEKGQTAEVFTRVRNEQGKNKRLAWTDFGVADGPLPDIFDRELHHSSNPALGGRLQQDVIETELSMMSPEGFARERLGWWGNGADGATTAFGTGNWEACDKEPGIEPADGLTIALAVSIDGAFSSIGATAKNPDGSHHLGATERKRGTSWLIESARDIQNRTDCDVVIDGRGPGAFLIPELEAAGIRLTVAGTSDVLDACALISEAVQDHNVTHFGYAELDAAVAGAQKRKVGDRWAWGRRSSKIDISMLEAVTLAFWGCLQGSSSAFNIW